MKTKKNKYIILTSGKDFRTVSEVMTSSMDCPMNHSTSRGVVFGGLQLFMSNLLEELKIVPSQTLINKLLEDKDVHKMIEDVLYLAYPECREVNGIKKLIQGEDQNVSTI